MDLGDRTSCYYFTLKARSTKFPGEVAVETIMVDTSDAWKYLALDTDDTCFNL